MHPEHPDTPIGAVSYASDVGQAANDDKPVVIVLEDSSSSSDEDTEKSPLISTSAKPLSEVDLSMPSTPVPGSKTDKQKVKFQLGQ